MKIEHIAITVSDNQEPEQIKDYLFRLWLDRNCFGYYWFEETTIDIDFTSADIKSILKERL